jgi:hypothetical protein
MIPPPNDFRIAAGIEPELPSATNTWTPAQIQKRFAGKRDLFATKRGRCSRDGGIYWRMTAERIALAEKGWIKCRVAKNAHGETGRGFSIARIIDLPVGTKSTYRDVRLECVMRTKADVSLSNGFTHRVIVALHPCTE